MNYKTHIAVSIIFYVLLLVTGTSSFATPTEKCSDICEKIEKAYFQATFNQSNLAYSVYSLLKHKYPKEKLSLDLQETYYLPYRLSTYNLLWLSAGSLNTPSGADLTNELDLLTGKRAIDESLQLDSITSNQPNWRPTATPAPANTTTDVSTIEPLKVKSHPWTDMLKGLTVPKKSSLLAFAPRDHFVIYFEHISKLTELEKSLKEIVKASKFFADIESSLNIKSLVSKRLGIDKLQALEPLVSEVLFISEDLDFFPSTNFAVVLSFRSPLVSSLSEMFLASAFTEKVGENLIIASSAELLQKLKNSHSNPSSSLLEAPELSYSLAVLDQRKDAFAYLSEDFILKLVSAPYRINSGRRANTLEKLQALQYTVFAYRVITGNWPGSFQQIAKEGYIDSANISSDFSIDKDGIVSDKNWGTIYNPKAISEVAIKEVSVEEKARYDAFREGYQSYWREFFDPVGIALTISDRLYLNTIILPLIDNSEYKWLKEVSGGEVKEMKSLQNPLRLPEISLLARFNFDQLLLTNAKQIVGSNLREIAEKATDEQKKALINKELQESLEMQEPFDVFNMLGEELIIGFGGNQNFNIRNIADVDAFIGFQLKDEGKLKHLITKVYQQVYRQVSSGRGGGFPFFQLSSEGPLENEYKNTKFYLIPAGFTNLYFTYIDNFVYFTISQLSINRLIDSVSDKKQISDNNKRAIDYMGTDNNILFLADLAGSEKGIETAAQQMFAALQYSGDPQNLSGYLTDIETLATTLKDQPEKINTYFPWMPDNISAVPLTYQAGRFEFGTTKMHLDEITFSSPYGDSPEELKQKFLKPNSTPFFRIVPPDFVSKTLTALKVIQSFSIGTKFTEHGLDTKVAITNPIKLNQDKRFGTETLGSKIIPPKLKNTKTNHLILLISGLVTLMMIGLVIILVRRRN